MTPVRLMKGYDPRFSYLMLFLGVWMDIYDPLWIGGILDVRGMWL